ncbi:MAG: PAS-domain containing protein [Pseudorhodoplanes sp.]|uniref:PAS-domain containing protein n=1 Tax=Pseudorhodoplanes sp. TaxID=1934341 RepID=UPI003D13CE8B
MTRFRKQDRLSAFENLLSLAGCWYWEATADLKLRTLSPNFADETGLSPKSWLGRRLSDISTRASHLSLAAVGEPFQDVIFIYRDEDGAERVMSLIGRPLRNGRGAIAGWRGTGRDITLQWNENRHAVAAQELLLGGMEEISEGIALYDADDRLVLFNQNYLFFRQGDGPTFTLGEKFQDIIRAAAYKGRYPGAIGCEEEWIQRRLAYHQNPSGTFELELDDGRWLQIIERRTSGGGTITVNTDITAMKRRDERALQAQRLQALGQLTGGVAHDFNNMLLLFECNLELLGKAVRAGRSAESYFEGCELAIGSGRGLVRRLLAVARQQPLQPHLVDCNDLVLQMQELLSRTLPHGIAVQAMTSPGLWRTLIDRSQLEAAILNLSLNARDAMPNGGTLRLSTANIFYSRSIVDGHQVVEPGEYVVLSVSDTGKGMTRDVASRALEPFFTTKANDRNSGLGLSTTYGFIKQSGGELEIESQPNRGTTIRMLLPRADRGAMRDKYMLGGSRPMRGKNR